MRTLFASLTLSVFTMFLSSASAEPASLVFSRATHSDYQTLINACEVKTRKSWRDSAVNSTSFLLYRSSKQCKNVLGNLYCPTFFVRLLNEPKCSSLVYTRGNGLVLDENDPLSNHLLSDNLEETPSFMLDAEVGALVVHPSDLFFEFNIVK